MNQNQSARCGQYAIHRTDTIWLKFLNSLYLLRLRLVDRRFLLLVQFQALLVDSNLHNLFFSIILYRRMIVKQLRQNGVKICQLYLLANHAYQPQIINHYGLTESITVAFFERFLDFIRNLVVIVCFLSVFSIPLTSIVHILDGSTSQQL